VESRRVEWRRVRYVDVDVDETMWCSKREEKQNEERKHTTDEPINRRRTRRKEGRILFNG